MINIFKILKYLRNTLKDVVVLPGPSSLDLGNCIADHLSSLSIPIDLRIFSDGESKIRINANLLNKKCIVVQSTYPPVDSHLLQDFDDYVIVVMNLELQKLYQLFLIWAMLDKIKNF